jgi:hypothetical protein
LILQHPIQFGTSEYQAHPDNDQTDYTDARKNTIKLQVQYSLPEDEHLDVRNTSKTKKSNKIIKEKKSILLVHTIYVLDKSL